MTDACLSALEANAWEEGTGRTGVPVAFLLVCGQPCSPWVLTASSLVCVCVLIPSSSEDPGHPGSEPPQGPHVTLTMSSKAPAPDTVRF